MCMHDRYVDVQQQQQQQLREEITNPAIVVVGGVGVDLIPDTPAVQLRKATHMLQRELRRDPIGT